MNNVLHKQHKYIYMETIKITKIAEMTGISYQRLLSYFDGELNLSVEELKRVNSALETIENTVAAQKTRLSKFMELLML